jgi:hypothetical protein
MYLNIEKSGFHKGRYVGYADGVWYIERRGRGWIAHHRERNHEPIPARTLSEMSEKLKAVADHTA